MADGVNQASVGLLLIQSAVMVCGQSQTSGILLQLVTPHCFPSLRSCSSSCDCHVLPPQHHYKCLILISPLIWPCHKPRTLFRKQAVCFFQNATVHSKKYFGPLKGVCVCGRVHLSMNLLNWIVSIQDVFSTVHVVSFLRTVLVHPSTSCHFWLF